MNPRYADLAARYKLGGMLPSELEMELQNIAAQEDAELRAFKECRCCGRLYTQSQWAQLPPADGGLFMEGDRSRSEWRTCNTCYSTIAAPV